MLACLSSLRSCRGSVNTYCPSGLFCGTRYLRGIKHFGRTYGMCTSCSRIGSSMHSTRLSSGLDGCAVRFSISGLGVRGLRLDTRIDGGELVTMLAKKYYVLILLLVLACCCIHALTVGGGLSTTGGTMVGTDHVGDSFVRRVARRVHAPLGSVIKFSSLVTTKKVDRRRRGRCTRRVRVDGACLLSLIDGIVSVTSVSSRARSTPGRVVSISAYYGRYVSRMLPSLEGKIRLRCRPLSMPIAVQTICP